MLPAIGPSHFLDGDAIEVAADEADDAESDEVADENDLTESMDVFLSCDASQSSLLGRLSMLLVRE